MRPFSLARMTEAAGHSLRRFPLVLLAALVAGVAAAAAVDAAPDQHAWLHAAMAAALAIPLFLTIDLMSERSADWRLPRLFRPVASLLGGALLLLYGATLPASIREADLFLYAQLTLGLHLLVAVLPLARGDIELAWRFDLALLLRFLNAAFFTVVLFAGLSLALLAVDTLLGVEVDELVYPRLWFVTAFVFNTAYFLGGVPRLGPQGQLPDPPPRMVRVFAQNILAPLVVVYLVILLAYLVKVLITAAWPSGWIGYLVSSVAVAGLLSLLLLRPALTRPGRGWLRVNARLFHVLMVPAVAMLALAAAKRIAQYGVTEPRYFLAVLTAWLAVVVLVGCRRPVPSPRAIPATLAALAFLTAVGPWSAYGVAHRSQLHRLEELLAANGRLEDRQIVSSSAEVPPEQRFEISGILYYLFDHFGPGALGGIAGDALRAELATTAASLGAGEAPAGALAEAAAGHAGLEYARWRGARRGDRLAVERAGRGRAVGVAGWDYLVAVDLVGENQQSVVLEADTCRLAMDWSRARLVLACRGDTLGTVELGPMLARLREIAPDRERHVVADSLLDASGAGPGRRFRLRVEECWWSIDGDRPGDGMLHGGLLIGGAAE